MHPHPQKHACNMKQMRREKPCLIAVGGNDAYVLHSHSTAGASVMGQQSLQQLDQGGGFHWVVVAGRLPVPHLHAHLCRCHQCLVLMLLHHIVSGLPKHASPDCKTSHTGCNACRCARTCNVTLVPVQMNTCCQASLQLHLCRTWLAQRWVVLVSHACADAVALLLMLAVCSCRGYRHTTAMQMCKLTAGQALPAGPAHHRRGCSQVAGWHHLDLSLTHLLGRFLHFAVGPHWSSALLPLAARPPPCIGMAV